MAELAYFVEESCWSGDKFRQTRKPVTFRVATIGKIDGRRLDFEFQADFGVWYDPDDDFLLAHLQRAEPQINWGQFVFWKKENFSRIEIIEIGEDKVVGSISVRRRMPGDACGIEDRANVIDMTEWSEKRDVPS